jgi:hypothetical protein
MTTIPDGRIHLASGRRIPLYSAVRHLLCYPPIAYTP